MDIISRVMDLVAAGALAGGSFLALLGGVHLGQGLKEHAGQLTQQGMWEIVGGGIIISLAALFKTITL